MPSPTSTLYTLRPDLAASFMEFDLEMNQRGFIGQRVLPVMEVAKQAGNFGKIPIEQLLQNREVGRAPGSGYARGSFTFTPDTYATLEYGAEEPIDDREAAMYADYFQAEQIASMRAYDAVLMAQEKRVAALLFNASTFSGHTAAVTNEWDSNHTTNAVPIDDVETAVRAVWTASGMWPNALIITRTVFRNLRNLDQVVERIQSAGAGSATKPSDITPAMLAAVFDLEEVIVAGSAKNSANEGQAVSIAPVWDDEYALVARIAKTADMREACLGRTFHWAEDGSMIGGAVESYRDEKIRGDVVRVRHDVCEKLLYAEAGYLLSNITT